MNSKPTTCIEFAFSQIGETVKSIDIEDYSPESFGNFTAVVKATSGTYKAIYDRGFFVEPIGEAMSADTLTKLLSLLSEFYENSQEYRT